jgi:hypothetical protein
MKAKLLALLAQLKVLLSNLNLSSLTSSLQLKGVLVGLLLGYFGSPVIKLAVDLVFLLVKGLLKLL